MATCKCCGTTMQKVVPGCTLCGSCEYRTLNTLLDMGPAELHAVHVLVVLLQRADLNKLRNKLYAELVMDDAKVEAMLDKMNKV